MIAIKPYYKGVEKELFEVFISAIREICSKDYTPEQIRAWIPAEYVHEKWKKRLESISPYIATINNQIVGYADIQDDGYIDHFFVDATHQSEGVGTALINTLLDSSSELSRVYSHVSITAKSFFERKGFVVVKENTVVMQGVELRNYIMERTS